MNEIEKFEVETSSHALLNLVRDIADFNKWYLKELNTIMLEDGNEGPMTIEVMNSMLHDMVDMYIRRYDFISEQSELDSMMKKFDK